MFKLNFKIALRNLWKYKGYTTINILGLTIGLAGCLMIFMFVKYQMSFDKGYKNEDRIYRMVSSWTYPEGEFYTHGVPIPFAPALRNDFPEIEKVAATESSWGIIHVKGENGAAEIKNGESLFYAEPEFFDIFNREWLYGEPKQALSAPNTVSLSEETADKYFGSWKNAIGKSIFLDGNNSYKVTGVFRDFPDNSSFPFRIVLSYASFPGKNVNKWGSVNSSSNCYVLLKEGIKPEGLRPALVKFMDKYYVDHGPGKENHYFQPLSELHHDSRFGNYGNQTMPYKQLIGLAVIGLFLLVTGCINFINLATAQAVSRSKEVGVRKVMGSRRGQLIVQFLSETVIITFIALLLACVVAELCLPAVERLLSANTSFRLLADPINFLFMLLLVVVVSLLAGLYPAAVMSGFSPALAIKNKISSANAGGLGLRKMLVVVQFSITSILIIATLVVVKQMSYVREKSLGFDPEAIATISMPTDSLSQMKYNTLREKLLQQPGVKEVSFCRSTPLSGSNQGTNFSYDTRQDEKFQLNLKMADEHYFKTFGLEVVAGKSLSRSDTLKEFVINETLVKMLGLKNPNEALGHILKFSGKTAKIVGVVKDFNNHSLHEKIDPIAIFTNINNYQLMAVKMNSSQLLSTMKEVEREWNAMYPDNIYDAVFVKDSIQNFYRTEQVMSTLFKIFAGVIIFISFIGLFGLVSFIAAQRTREIAIRKVLGASTLELVQMLNRSFLWMVLIANLVAWPLAYIFVSKWLDGFAYRVDLSVWPFAIAMILSVFITILTVSLRSYRAANTNPIDALKYE